MAKAICTDWVGSEYYSKADVLTAIEAYFENSGEIHKPEEIIAHFMGIIRELDVKTVIKIMKLQDKLYCIDD